MTNRRCIVTGCTGFIGSYLCNTLAERNSILLVPRGDITGITPAIKLAQLLSGELNDELAKFGPTHLIHCGGIAHRGKPRSDAEREALNESNINLPIRLAKLAKQIGIQRFVFLSSVGIHGSSTKGDSRITEDSPICPTNEYTASKWAAEVKLRECLSGSGCALTVARPALVYGPGMPGNLKTLVQAIDSGLPLPFASVNNSRSFVSVNNLVSAIETIAFHHLAGDQSYVIADNETISTNQLIRLISVVRNKRCSLYPVPCGTLRIFSKLPAIGGKISQLMDDLVVDSSKLCDQLGWQQPFKQSEEMITAFANPVQRV
jgi:nucleoside-diphosphate-sugar epimerase